ncbi:hypothetical protein HDU91_007348 [Kappamyces sp. JEL0680]|nr:hypothetical protein HDU91_007348 [Kappamyces sp. JEL0680]
MDPRFLKYGDPKKNARNLVVGDVVDRHLQDGDVVLFNRQPSLHKLSIMSHFVKVRPWRTFRFNECVCAPYNADFDGDEMNLHVPQTEEARAEALELMGVKANLVTPRNGEPLIAATQDFITASFLLSRKDRFYDRATFTQICSYLDDATGTIDLPAPTILKPVELWSGKQIFGVLLKPNSSAKIDINLETKCRTFGKDEKNLKTGVSFGNSKTAAGVPFDNSLCPNDGWVVIHNSELLCGVIDKAIIGDGSKKSMFYTVLRDYGSVQAANCMNKISKLSARWLANQGFSIGIDDVQPGRNLREAKQKTVQKGYDDCDESILKSTKGELQNQAGLDSEATLEIRDDVGTVCFAELNKYNAPLIMSLCGSKGSKINVSQMVACVGQQIISGSRIPNGFGDRSLPHFPKNSKTPAAKGFVGNSFYTGLSPTEFLFHAVSGREGLVDTAVKTAETGYMSRRLMKALEDLVCHYDQSVRDSTGGVVQFKYGDDGLDPAMIEGDKQPVDFSRILLHVEAQIPCGKKLKESDFLSILAKELEAPDANKYSDAFRLALKEFLTKSVGTRASGRPALLTPASPNAISKEQLLEFIRICRKKHRNAMIEPGTAVGAIGAQSIGEPGTQMTLKTFHFAGVASMNITLGVPRIKEIINAAKKISTPIIQAPLIAKIGKYGKDQILYAAEASTRVVKGRIEKTLLGEVVNYIQEVIDNDELSLRIKIDVSVIKQLHLEVDIDSIRWAIVRAPKLKISDSNIRIENKNTLRVIVTKSLKEALNPFVLLQTLKRALPKVVIKGLSTATRAVINNVQAEKRLELMVEGYGLLEVMGTSGVDGVRCKSNHVLETLSTLGIEAARQTIINEIVHTMQSHGMTIDIRHVMLLADLMSFKGEILGITRFGIAKMKDSVLMLASFEKTTDHLFEASFYGKKDTIRGVSECIIMGVPMSLGTGIFKVVQESAPLVLDQKNTLLY